MALAGGIEEEEEEVFGVCVGGRFHQGSAIETEEEDEDEDDVEAERASEREEDEDAWDFISNDAELDEEEDGRLESAESGKSDCSSSSSS